ncbi:MAG: serine/threonine protein kinase [Paracrocinitomix sp.]|jgi:serine/threonine protein kinase
MFKAGRDAAATALGQLTRMSNPIVPGYGELEKIGSGGFAAVYRATQTAVGREVALKLLHHAIADEDTERRFQRECRVVGSLSWHPHIAAVLDAGADDEGRSYLAFELLSGGSLGDRLKASGPIPWPEAVTFAVQMADALAAAHEEDVLHRDVKPDNILIDRLGRAKLADFGIAQMHDGNQTKSGVITATLAHAAPEVLNGKRATKLSDVYLLGSTLFELIVGEPPFGKMLGNDFFGAIQRIATEPAPRLDATHGVAVPAGLTDAVDRALRKDPADRFSSAAQFGLALRSLQQDQGRPPTEMPFVEARSGRSELEIQVQAAPASPGNHPIAEPAATSLVLTGSAVAVSSSGVDDAAPVVQPIDLQPSTAAQRSLLPLALAALVVSALVGGAAFFFIRDGEDTATNQITAFEPLATDSQDGQLADNAVDNNLTTGWLTPNGPDGHQIVIGFGIPFFLDSIRVHTGPDPSGSGVLANSRGLGPTVIEFSDGTTRELDLDPAQPVRTININKRTSSLAIRTLSQGAQPVAIREIEFIVEAQP